MAVGTDSRSYEALPVAVAIVDLDARITYVNRAAVSRYGWRSAGSAVGLSAAVLGEGLPERLAGGVSWRGELTATSAEGIFLAAFEAAPIHDDEGEVVGAVVVCLDASRRAEAERSAERLSRLQAVTARLGGASTAEEIALVVCDHAAAGLGATSSGFWRLVDDDESLELVRHVGIRAGVEAAFERFGVDAPLPARDALASRAVVVLDGQADRDLRYPMLADLPDDHRVSVVVPVLRDGRPLGVLSLGFRNPHPVSGDDHRFLLALVDQAAQALERVRNAEQERAARSRQELLARATGVLAGSSAVESMVTAVGRIAVQSFADAFSVQLVENGDSRSVAVANADPQVEELMATILPTEVGARMRRFLDELVEGGRSTLAPQLEPHTWETLLGDRTAAESMRALDVGSAIVVGLHSGGRRLGVLAVTRRREREPFDHDAFVLVAELAGRMASAIDGALAHQSRAEVARLLQASLLPPRLPEIPGVTLAARYDPIGDGSLVGGDFYDVFPLDGRRWCVVLGDVCGQGVEAASLTALVRYTIRAAARMWSSPAEILRFTNDAILDQDVGERFCTVLLAVLAPRAGGMAVELAVGGHHLPLHRPAGGVAVPIGRQGTALGLVRQPDLEDSSVLLGVGDLLVLTTDGVLEARDRGGRLVADHFLDALVAEHADGGAEALAAAIRAAVLELGDGRTIDDVAVLVVEVTGEGNDEGEGDRESTTAVPAAPFGERFPPDIASVTEVRRAVAGWLEVQGITGSRVPDLLLAVTELATNAVRSARTAVEVRAWLTADAVMVEVTDDGAGFDPTAVPGPRDIDPLAERGRGLFIVAALVDECTIESTVNGTIVRCYLAR